MGEKLKKSYRKEEEFLDEFYNVAAEAASFLQGEWTPNPKCSDETRRNRDYFLSTGDLNSLAFETAEVYHDQDGFSSAQIILRSTKRIVNIRVRMAGDKFVSEKIVDKEP